MILPYFDYGDVMYMFANNNKLEKLDRLHKRGLKISQRITTHIEEDELLNCCNISNLSNRRMVHLRNFMFNRKHLCKPVVIEEEYCTRSKDGPIFNIEKPNCEAYKRSICYSGCKEWNNVDPDIRNLNNIFEFKRHQKSWLLNTYKT